MTTPWTRPRTSDNIDDSYIHFILDQLEDTVGELRLPLRMSKVPPSLSFLGFGSKSMLTFAHSDDAYHTRYTDKEWNEYSQPWEGDAANIYRCVRVCGCAVMQAI